MTDDPFQPLNQQWSLIDIPIEGLISQVPEGWVKGLRV